MASLPQRHSWNISALYNPPLSCNIVHNHYIHLHIGDKSGQYCRLCTTDPPWPGNCCFVAVNLFFCLSHFCEPKQKNSNKAYMQIYWLTRQSRRNDWFLQTHSDSSDTPLLILSYCWSVETRGSRAFGTWLREQKYYRPQNCCIQILF